MISMKSFLIPVSLLLSAVLADVNIAALGSSYAFGQDLAKPYGRVLADKLAAHKGTKANFQNYALPGSTLNSINQDQANKLKNYKWDAIVITSGGNDFKYVSCLANPRDPSCKNVPTRDKFISLWGTALDAVWANLPATKPPVYVVTYPRFLGNFGVCNPSNTDCPLTPDQIAASKETYDKVVWWTVNALDAWKAKGSGRNGVKLVPMRSFSGGHEIGSAPDKQWINGKNKPRAGNGTPLHPTQAAANFMGTAVFNDLIGKAFNDQ